MGTLVQERARASLSSVPGSAVIIHGRLNSLAIGTIVAIARSSADLVIVVSDRYDPRIELPAAAAGALVLCKERDGLAMVDAVLASAGVVVAMYGDGSHDPFQIPALIGQARGGQDVVAYTTTMSSCVDETVRRLNNCRHGNVDQSFIAAPHRAFEGFSRSDGGDLSRFISDHARRSGLKIRPVSPGTDGSGLDMYRIGVVVPAYNEELLLEETVRGIPPYVTRIYVIDDCSRDRTSEITKRLVLENPRVTVLHHERNRGVGGSIIDGYRLALADDMDYVAVMAGDNQMDPAELPRLLMPVIEGKTDYAKGNRLLSRSMSKGMSQWRRFGNTLLSLLNKIASGYWHISDPQNGYTVISRRALETLDLDAVYTYYGYCNDLLVKLNAFGLRTADVPIPARYGKERSKIRYGRFIFKVSPMLLRGFLWRLRVKYTVLDFHPLVLSYLSGMVLLPAGVLLGLVALPLLIINAGGFALTEIFAAVLALAGLQYLITAMIHDAMADRWTRTDVGKA